jgi:hypothetical protein
MPMTIEVYRVNPATGVRTCVRKRHAVKPAKIPTLGPKYPPCICPRYSDRAPDQSREGTR